MNIAQEKYHAHDQLSVVVPVYNEEDNVLPLAERVHAALTGISWPWQFLRRDDGSSVEARARLGQDAACYPEHVCAVIRPRNFGQTGAMHAARDVAQGRAAV